MPYAQPLCNVKDARLSVVKKILLSNKSLGEQEIRLKIVFISFRKNQNTLQKKKKMSIIRFFFLIQKKIHQPSKVIYYDI